MDMFETLANEYFTATVFQNCPIFRADASQLEHRTFSEDKLRRAIDRKLRGLRAALRDDGDVASELEGVVDKLTSLALRRASRREHAARKRWMEFKLYDLLTLSEKAVKRRSTSAAATNLQSSTPVHECVYYPEVQMSLSSICTQITSREEETRTSIEDEDRWLSGESEDVLDSEETIHEDTMTGFCFDPSEDSRLSFEPTPSSSPTKSYRTFVARVHSPTRARSRLNRNLFPRSNIAKRSRPRLRRSEQVKRPEGLRCLQGPAFELASAVQCYRSKVERRQKKHKKKHGRNARSHLKSSMPIQMSEQEIYEPMVGLAEQAEESDSSISDKLNVIELSQEAGNVSGYGGYDSYADVPMPRGKFVVSDNKIFETDRSHGIDRAYMQNMNTYDNDLCEPSTSTGIRHTAVNVQCDVTTFTNPFFTAASPTLSPGSPEDYVCPSSTSEITTSVTNLAAPVRTLNKEVAASIESATHPANRTRPKLDYDGVNFHCYRDRISSEEIVFYGLWKRGRNASELKVRGTRKYRKAAPGVVATPVRSDGRKVGQGSPDSGRSAGSPVGGGVTRRNADSRVEKSMKVSGEYDAIPAKHDSNRLAQKPRFSTSPITRCPTRTKPINTTFRSPVIPNVASQDSAGSPRDVKNDRSHDENNKRIKMSDRDKIPMSVVIRASDRTTTSRTSPTRLNHSDSTNRSSSSCCSPSSIVTVRNRCRAGAKPKQDAFNATDRNANISPNSSPVGVKRTVKRTKKVFNKTQREARDKENFNCPRVNRSLETSSVPAKNRIQKLQHESRVPLICTESNENSQTGNTSNYGVDEEIGMKFSAVSKTTDAKNVTVNTCVNSVDSKMYVSNILQNIESASNNFALRNLFGRKDEVNPVSGNLLVAETFSGYSVDYEVPAGGPNDRHALPNNYDARNDVVDPGRLTASAEVFIPSPSSDSYASCNGLEEPLVPPWLFRVLSDQRDSEEGAGSVGGGGRGEGAGAGDGRGVHTLPSTSDEYSSLVSTDTSLETHEALNLDGLVSAQETMAPNDSDQDSDSSESSGATAQTWVRLEDELGRRRRAPTSAAAARAQRPSSGRRAHESPSGADADVSSVDDDLVGG